MSASLFRTRSATIIGLALALHATWAPSQAQVNLPRTAKPPALMPERTGAESKEEIEDEKEDQVKRTQFRLLTLQGKEKLGAKDKKYDPNDLIRAKRQMSTMSRSAAAWPMQQPSAGTSSFSAMAANIGPSQWTSIGPGNIGGRTRSIVTHPTDPNTLYAGAVGGGVWKTTDGGANWNPLNDFMASIAVSTLVMDPTNANVLYAGTGEGYPGDGLRGAGVFKTTNAGVTWTQLASTVDPSLEFINRIAVHPTNGQILLMASRGGLHRSTNGGTSWTRIIQEGTCDDVDFHPTNGNEAVATCYAFTSQALWSSNAGVSWTPAGGTSIGPSRTEIAYSRSNPSIIYASADINMGELYRSTDGGRTYSLRNTGNSYLSGQGWYDNALWVDPLNPNNVMVGGVGMSLTRDGGQTLENAWIGELHADQHAIVHAQNYSATNRVVWVGNDGGIYRTNDFLNLGIHPWQNRNNNYAVTQFYGGNGHPTLNLVMGGTQDNGTPRYAGVRNAWLDNTFADGGMVAVDPRVGAGGIATFYGETQNGWLWRMKFDGAGNNLEYVSLLSGDMGFALWVAPIVLDPNNPDRLYQGRQRLWRLDSPREANPGVTPWTPVSPENDMISAIAVAKGNSDIIWTGGAGGTIQSTTNGTNPNPTWNTRNVPARLGWYVTRLAIDATNHSRIYATFGGFLPDNVWRSEDAGLTWTDITSNLPDVPVRSLVIHPSNSNFIYVGTEAGVFASENRGGTWSPTNDGPTNASVDELFWVGNRLHAATHGRGMWSITVNAPPTAAITAPTAGQNFAAGSNITLNATASDPDGTVSRVEFLQGTTVLGSDNTAPYSFIWNNVPAGTYDLVARAVDNDNATGNSAAVRITVGGVAGITLPGRIQAEDYKAGGQNVGYNDLTAGNTGGQHRPADNVDIEATTDAGGGFNVGWIQAGEWLAYDVNVATTRAYTLTARMASGVAAGSAARTLVMSVDGTNVATFNLTQFTGWQGWHNVTVNNVNLTAGAHVVRLTMSNGDFNVNWVDVTAPANLPPVANAGADRTVPVNTTVTLDGRSSSDPDNGPSVLSYAWTQVSGPAATLNNPNTAQPSFIAGTAGTYVFRLTVSDGAATATDDVQVTANSGVVYIELPGRIEAENYKAGGQGVGYNDLTAGNTGGQHRPADNVDIEATTDAGGGFNVGWIQAGEWLAYDVNVATTRAYTITARMASGAAAGSGARTLVMSVDGINVATFNLTEFAGWQGWRSIAVGNVNLTAGPHVVRLTMSNGDFNVNWVDVTASANLAPVANAGADRTVPVNTAVTLDGRGSSDPDNGPSALTYAWTQVTGPSVTLNNAGTSQPSFTPGAAGTYAFRLAVNDGAATAADTVQVIANTGNAITLPGRIQAEDYKAGGQGVGFNDLTAGNTGGQYRTDNVDIEAATDAGGGYNVGWIQATEWLAYDVNVTTAGTYSLTARMASGAAGTKTMTMSVDGTNVATFSMTENSGWQGWRDIVVTGVSLTAGAHVVRLTATTGDFNVNYVDVQPGSGPELLLNGNFSNGLASWTPQVLNTAAATFAVDAGSAKGTITAQGAQPWEIQIFQPVALAAGKTYTLKFDVKAEATPKNFKVVVEHNADPWTKYHEQQYTVTAAANTFQSYTITWTQGVADASVRVGFHFGTYNVSDVWLDNVSLK